jgi:hypothetical protein
MRNPIGFIPRDQDDEEMDGVEDELHRLREIWDARQLAEALAADQMLKESREVLFAQVRSYADELQELDPAVHSAAQEVARIALAQSYAETVQERLDVLHCDARRLMLAVAEAKRQRANSTKLLTKMQHLAPYAEWLFYALVWGGLLFGGLLFAFIAEGG